MHLQVCPRFNLLLICDFMAQMQDIAFDKTSVLILRVVYLRNSGCVQKNHNLIGRIPPLMTKPVEMRSVTSRRRSVDAHTVCTAFSERTLCVLTVRWRTVELFCACTTIFDALCEHERTGTFFHELKTILNR